MGPSGSCAVDSKSLAEPGLVTKEAVEFVEIGGKVTRVESDPRGDPTAEETGGNSIPEEEEGTK